jgi:hypothetical protein
MGDLREEVEAGIEGFQITIKTKLNYYVGMVHETEDPNGIKVLCVVKSIDKVHIENGLLTMDSVVTPIAVVGENNG